MDEDHNTPLAITDCQGGLLDPIPEVPSTMEISFSPSEPGRTEGNRSSSTEVPGSGYHRGESASDTIQPILIEVFHSTGKNEEKTNSGLQKIKPIYPSSTLQDGRCASFERDLGKRRLHDKIRSKRCLYRGTYSSKFKTLLSFPKQREKLPIQGVKLRIEHCTKNLHQATKICPGTIDRSQFLSQ